MITMRCSCFTAALVVATGLSLAPTACLHAETPLSGNAVPGVCLLSREAVFGQSKVGQAASLRLRQLAEAGKAQLDEQGKPLRADLQSFQQKAASLSEVQRKEQGAALQVRLQAFQQQGKDFSTRVELTQAKVVQTLAQDAQPALADVYQNHHCGLLINRDAVLGGNLANDLTAEVIQGLDRKVSTIAFDLEPLPTTPSH